MGPVWDYDIAWHNANYCEGDLSTGWAYQFPCTDDYWQVPFWWSRLLEDPLYKDHLACRWKNLRQTTLSNAWFDQYIDSIAGQLNEAQARNFVQWPILGTYVWPNPWPYPATYQGEVSALKLWIHSRLSWLDTNMPGTCTTPVSNGIAETQATFRIYPNPVSDHLSVVGYTTEAVLMEIAVYNPQGVVLLTSGNSLKSSGEWHELFDVSGFKPGIYLLRISMNGRTHTQRFIKI